jgi:indole-3-glycerol phosphate synthase
LAELAHAARAAKIEPLFEVVDEAELEASLACGARVIGVNARDLDALVMDLDRAGRVLAAIPAPCVAVHLSGLKARENVSKVAAGRADAALMGEALMRLDDPRALLGTFVRAASGLDG